MAQETIRLYVWDEETDRGSEEIITVSQRRKYRMRTFLDKTFITEYSIIEAINQVSDEDTWIYSFINETADGRNIYYRCNMVKKEEYNVQQEYIC